MAAAIASATAALMRSLDLAKALRDNIPQMSAPRRRFEVHGFGREANSALTGFAPPPVGCR
jgi:hypothetical protein